jgi:serine/threonine-protein kinase
MGQKTVISAQAVEIPGLPGRLEAFPVYRVTERASGSDKYERIRLHVESALRPSAERREAALRELPEETRAWLLKENTRKAATIVKRLKDQAVQLTYEWCSSGLLSFEAEPPSRPGAGHGPLLGWTLAEDVAAYAERGRQEALRKHEALQEEAQQLADALAPHPVAGLLSVSSRHDTPALERLLAAGRQVMFQGGTAALGEGTVLRRLTGDEQLVCLLARRDDKDYRPEGELEPPGGQAVVFAATHKITGTLVAIKRPRRRDEDSLKRMLGEIEAMTRFGGHRNVVPVLDASAEGAWFAMPLAKATARGQAAQLRDEEQLRDLVMAMIEGLRAPHQQGWIHRDLKPENILMINGQWAIADWGIGRRPHGMTTTPGRTHVGSLYGTEGYAAPEASLDAHKAGPPADIYSIGQIIGNILTGEQPQPNIPLLPDHPGWRQVVERATQLDPGSRPATVDDLQSLLERALDPRPSESRP